MGHIYLSHSHPIAIYPVHTIPWDVSHGIPIGMTFPWTSLGLSMGHIYLSHSYPIASQFMPVQSHAIPIGIPFPWKSLCLFLGMRIHLELIPEGPALKNRVLKAKP